MKDGWCQNSGRWIATMDFIGSYPKTCPYNGECDHCDYFEEREQTPYIIRKRRLINEVFK